MSSPHTRLPFLLFALLLITGSALWSLSPRAVGSGGAAVRAPGSAPAVQGQASAWTLEGIDTPRSLADMTDRSLRLDSQGRPHLVYGGDGLYYARHDGTTWQIEVVDASPGVGRFAALALDAADQPHVSYLDEAAERLRYARWTTATGWQVETVLGTGCGGYHTSIAVDAAGRPHISHQRCGANDTLGYATLDPVTGWTLEIVDGSVLAGGYSSIALDAAGVPRISYAHEGTGELRYAFRAPGGGWTRETVVDLVAGAAFTSLALDGGGVSHIGYLDQHGGNLGHAVRGSAGGWSTEVVDGAAVGGHTSIALDANGHPRVSYYAAGGGNLRLASWTPAAGWTLEVVDSAGDTGLFTSLVLDADGSPRISYLDRPSGGLKLASWSSAAGWSFEVVDTGGDPGQYASLATAPDGSLHVAYFDALGRSLRHARWSAAAGWSTETVDSGTFVGEYASLALSAAGHPRICYLDRDGRRLTYASWSPAGWTIEVIAGPTLFDTYGALAVDGQDRPHVTYFDALAGEFRYATRTAAVGWSLETIDQVEQGLGGAYSSIAIDDQDRPHVSYVDSAGGPSSSLKYARRDPATGWGRETVATVGAGRGYNAITLEDDGRAHVAFYDPGTDAVRHGLRNLPPGAGWVAETVASNVLLFSPLSLALTASGSPRIAYYHAPAGALRYAARDAGGSWSNEPVASSGGLLAGHPALDFDAEGRPVIAFYDGLRRDLMAAHGVSNPVVGLAKRVTSVVDLGGGQVDVGLLFTLENLSDVALEDVQVTDLMTTTFPPPSTFAVVSGPTATGTLVANPGFDGGTDPALLGAAGSTLPAFQLATVSVTARVSLGGASGPFLNSALAGARGATGGTTTDTSDDGDDPDPNGDDNPDQPGENDPTTIAVPALTLSVGSTTTSVTTAGQVVPYVYQVTNAGSVTLTGISLVDDLVDAPPACPQSSLAIAESMSCTGQHTVTQAEVDGGGSLTNLATADSVQSAPATASLGIPIVRIAGLQVSKIGVADPGPDGVVEAGDSIDYAFLVTNTGQVTLSNLGVDDPLVLTVLCPSGLPIPSLAPAASESCTGSYAVTQVDVDAGQVVNTARVTAERPGGPVLDVDASELTVIAGLPVLGVAKQVVSIDDLGGGQVDVGFLLTLENLGNVTLTNVQVTDLLTATFPPPSTFIVLVGPTATGTLVANPGFDGGGDAMLLDAVASILAPTATGTIGFTVRSTLNGTSGPLFNTALGTAQGASGGSTSDASHDGADPDPNGDGNPDQPGENAPTTIAVPALTLSVGSTTTSVTTAGQVVPYVYQVTNAGSVTLTGISLVDDLADAPPACPQSSLAIAESMSCTGQHTVTQAEVDGGGSLTNLATADSVQSAPATASLGIPIVRIAGLQVSKIGVADPGPDGVVEAGDSIDYAFLVTNTGQVTLSNLGVDDPLVLTVLCPSGLPIPSLAPAASESCTGSYAVTQVDVDAGQVVNTARVTAERPGGPVLDVDASELTVIAGLPVLGVAKQVVSIDDLGGGQVDVGFLLTLENLGNVTLTNVQVTDLLTATFPPPSTFIVLVGPTATGTLVANPGFDGGGDAMLLDAVASTLAPAATGTIGFTVRSTLNGTSGPLFNTALGTAQGASGGSTSDASHDGPDPDPNGDGNPDQAGENDPTAITLPTAPVDVPTLDSWSLAVLSLLLAALALRARRRSGASSRG